MWLPSRGGIGNRSNPGQAEIGDDPHPEHAEQKGPQSTGESGVRGRELDHQAQAHGKQHGQEHVGQGPGDGHQHHVPTRVAHVAFVDGNGLGPAEHDGREQGRDREHDKAHGIDMRYGIEGQAAEHTGGLIAAQRRHPAVSHLMQNNPQKHWHESRGQFGQTGGKITGEHLQRATTFPGRAQEEERSERRPLARRPLLRRLRPSGRPLSGA